MTIFPIAISAFESRFRERGKMFRRNLFILFSLPNFVWSGTGDFCPCLPNKQCPVFDDAYPQLPTWIFYFDEAFINHGVEESLTLTKGPGASLIKVASRPSKVLYCDGTDVCTITEYLTTTAPHANCIRYVSCRVTIMFWIKMNKREDELQRMASSGSKTTNVMMFPTLGFNITYNHEDEKWLCSIKGRWKVGEIAYVMKDSNTWNHITLMLRGDEPFDMLIFHNGHLSATQTATKLNVADERNSQQPFIFTSIPGQAVHPIFFIDEFKVMRFPLTNKEVLGIYNDEVL